MEKKREAECRNFNRVKIKPESVLEHHWFGNPLERFKVMKNKEWYPRIRYSSFEDDVEKKTWRGTNHRMSYEMS